MYGLDGPGEPGEPGWGDHAGLYPGENPLSTAGEKPAAPGVIPLPTPGDQACHDGVAPAFHGVICGDPTELPAGLAPAPKNIPVPAPEKVTK